MWSVGAGEQEREVHCEWVRGELGRVVVNDDHCNMGMRPISTQSWCIGGVCVSVGGNSVE